MSWYALRSISTTTRHAALDEITSVPFKNKKGLVKGLYTLVVICPGYQVLGFRILPLISSGWPLRSPTPIAAVKIVRPKKCPKFQKVQKSPETKLKKWRAVGPKIQNVAKGPGPRLDVIGG